MRYTITLDSVPYNQEIKGSIWTIDELNVKNRIMRSISILLYNKRGKQTGQAIAVAKSFTNITVVRLC